MSIVVSECGLSFITEVGELGGIKEVKLSFITEVGGLAFITEVGELAFVGLWSRHMLIYIYIYI
jgi:hypothetical protein